MANDMKAIDIGDEPELVRLAEDVRRAGEPRLLRRNGEDLVMVVPLPVSDQTGNRKPSEADLVAFRTSAGSWADIDTDALIEYIYRAREEGSRPGDRP